MTAGLSRRGFVAGTIGAAAATAMRTSAGAAPADAAPLPTQVRRRIDALIAAMSTGDKIAQLNVPVVVPGDPGSTPVATTADQDRYVRGGWEHNGLTLGPGGGFFGLVNESLFGSIPLDHPKTPRQQAERHNELQRLAQQTSLAIPVLQISEGTHGSIGPGATIFPEGLGLGATWNPQLVGQVYGAIGAEARAVGIHAISTIPAELNRDPRYGRSIWSFGEDPYLVTRYLEALVPAAQADLRTGPAVSLVTFPAESPNVGGLEGSSIELGERELRLIHLPPWRAGFSAGSLMTEASEQVIDGLPVHGSPKYLTELLREELGFGGVVIGIGFEGLLKDRIAATPARAGALALRAGVDIGLGWHDAYLDGLADGVRTGAVPTALLDQAVRRVLTLKYRLGLFDQPYADPARAEAVVNRPAHRQLALRAAQESMVLLRNEKNLLPLDAGVRRIALIGQNADDARNLLGDYSAWPALHDVPTILDRLKATGRQITYAAGCATTGTDRSGFAAAVAAAKNADVAVVVLGEETKGGYLNPGRTNGELADVSRLDLSGVQQELLEAVHATGTSVVLVLINGRPLSVRWAAENIPAILEAWLPGEQGAQAVVDVLTGATDPSGRLPITVPRSVGQLPMYYNVKGSRAAADSYVDLPSTPLYPFGHGLSYTTFAVSNVRLSRKRIARDGSTEVRAELRNTGKRTGSAVLQLYATDDEASVAVPALQLRGLAKVRLEPGTAASVVIPLAAMDLAVVDADNRTRVEPGTFTLRVGTSSAALPHSLQLTVT
ncbi:glycoside hydrolase family 3 C-terminal domain-containing protein [Kribbella sp. NPDC004536]|uniref:glycoside hydrolase family 3 C-terminal domain-containing protein n=1 Tax=Kribbella sp. NPDC004536 TaxID=3364106 RepID=UPI0036BB51B2